MHWFQILLECGKPKVNIYTEDPRYYIKKNKKLFLSKKARSSRSKHKEEKEMKSRLSEKGKKTEKNQWKQSSEDDLKEALRISLLDVKPRRASDSGLAERTSQSDPGGNTPSTMRRGEMSPRLKVEPPSRGGNGEDGEGCKEKEQEEGKEKSNNSFLKIPGFKNGLMDRLNKKRGIAKESFDNLAAKDIIIPQVEEESHPEEEKIVIDETLKVLLESSSRLTKTHDPKKRSRPSSPRSPEPTDARMPKCSPRQRKRDRNLYQRAGITIGRKCMFLLIAFGHTFLLKWL